MQKNVCDTVVFLGDSWLSDRRFKGVIYSDRAEEFIKLAPHSYKHKSIIELKNLSKGGLTWDKIINNENLLSSWVRQKPKVTVIHASACEIVNRSFNFDKEISEGKFYADRLVGHINYLSDFARQHMTPQVFQQWDPEHRFVVPVLPDWGTFQQHRPNSISSEEYRKTRSRINKVLKEKAIKFWVNHKALIISPHMENIIFEGVHLSERDQVKFNKQIVQGVAKVICDSCALNESDKKESLKLVLKSKCQNKSI